MILVVMGVTSCGKTTVGKILGERLGLPFFDADDFHPKANVDKMAARIPLTDEDRWPWLQRLVDGMGEWEKTGGAVLACSALREVYRDFLRKGSPDVRFIHLKGSKELIRRRMEARKGHYMPPALIDSQFAALEEPGEEAIVVDIAPAPEEIAEEILRRVG